MKPIEIRLHRKFDGKIKTVTIKKTPTNKYFASILVETKDIEKKPEAIKPNTTIGIDLGIKDFITLSTGEKIANPKILKQYERKLIKAQRKASRKVKGSNNRKKANFRVAKIHEKIKNIRKDFLHKLSYRLSHENQVDSLVIEDLNVSGMVKNHKLAKSIGACSWYEFVRQLEYKSLWYGKNLIKIGRFEPSSKLCSNCGTINQELKLEDREWICKNCGSVHDRDINAAINIKNIGLGIRNKIPMERRESTLVESRCNNATR
jgi:putative transposase